MAAKKKVTKKATKKAVRNITITYINNHGGGFAGSIKVPAKTDISTFFKSKMKSENPNNYLIRVNRSVVLPNYVLKSNDIITVTPTKVDGA